jgi:hypothetical protein
MTYSPPNPSLNRLHPTSIEFPVQSTLGEEEEKREKMK